MTLWVESLIVFIPILYLIYMWKNKYSSYTFEIKRKKKTLEILIPTLPPLTLIIFGCFLARFFSCSDC